MLPYLAAPAFKAGKLLEIGFLLGGGPLRPAGHNFLAAPGQFRNQILAQHLIEFIRKVRRQHERQLGLGPGFLVDAHLQRLEPDFVFGGDNFGEDFFGYRKLGSRRLFVLGGLIGGTRRIRQHGRIFAGLGAALGAGPGFGASRKARAPGLFGLFDPIGFDFAQAEGHHRDQFLQGFRDIAASVQIVGQGRIQIGEVGFAKFGVPLAAEQLLDNDGHAAFQRGNGFRFVDQRDQPIAFGFKHRLPINNLGRLGLNFNYLCCRGARHLASGICSAGRKKYVQFAVSSAGVCLQSINRDGGSIFHYFVVFRRPHAPQPYSRIKSGRYRPINGKLARRKPFSISFSRFFSPR